jgi:energy-coupling factor transporter ATP-binding protein EcfA2
MSLELAVKQLATMVAANGAVMVVGPPGCGKVELSKMAALQMTGKEPRHVNMAIIDDTRYQWSPPPTVVTTSSDLDKALDVPEGTAVILDELDKVPESRQLTMVAPILEFLMRGRPTFVCVQKPENVLPIIRTRLRQVEMEELYPEKERLEAWARQ